MAESALERQGDWKDQADQWLGSTRVITGGNPYQGPRRKRSRTLPWTEDCPPKARDQEKKPEWEGGGDFRRGRGGFGERGKRTREERGGMEEKTDGDTETQIWRNPKAERDRKLCGEEALGGREKEQQKDAEEYLKRKEETQAAGRGPRGQGDGTEGVAALQFLKSLGSPSSRHCLAAGLLTHSPHSSRVAEVGLSFRRAGPLVHLNGRVRLGQRRRCGCWAALSTLLPPQIRSPM